MTTPSACELTLFDDVVTHNITVMLQQQHTRLAQLDRPYAQRSLTARNYGSAITALGDYLARIDAPLPATHVPAP